MGEHSAMEGATTPDLEEHGVRGWLAHRRAEHEREQARERAEREHEQARDAHYHATLAKLAAGDDSDQTIAELRELAEPRWQKEARATLFTYTNHVLADDVLSLEEENRWEQVTDALGIHSADLWRPSSAACWRGSGSHNSTTDDCRN